MKDNLEYKRQKQKKKQKRLWKELQSTEQGECIGGEQWEVVDMKKQLHPIGYYINDREEMIRQLFTVIRGERLKKMLPPVLKDMDLDELKADCLIHLVGMSSKRIKAILDGQDLDASSNESDSDNDTDSVTAADDSTKNSSAAIRTSAFMSNTKQRLDDSGSADDTLEIEIGESNSDFFGSNDDLISPKRHKRKKLKRTHHQQTAQQVEPCIDLVSDFQIRVGVEHDQSELSSSVNNSSDKKDGNKGKTLLEILELEMRARAIRAILKRDNNTSSSPVAPSQEETGDDNISSSRAEFSGQLSVDNELCVEGDKASEEADTIETDKNIRDDEIHSKQQEINSNVIDGSSETKMEDNNETENVGTGNDDDDVMIIENSGSSWAQRWLEKKSKDVKRLVSTSKMCTTIRNKMKKSKLSSDQSSTTDNSIPSEFKGSIDEYKMLTKITPPSQLLEQDTPPPNTSEVETQINEETENAPS